MRDRPRQRGARTSEALRCLRLLLTGEEVHFEGRFFSLHGAIRPAPAPPIPILVGGRSDAALPRAGELGDGWLALWVSPRRFEEAVGRIAATAREAARHALAARATALGGLRSVPCTGPSPVEHGDGSRLLVALRAVRAYAPAGPPAAIAEALAPYLAAGCRRFNFVPETASLSGAIQAVAEVKTLLAS